MEKTDLMGYVKKVVPWIGAAATGGVPALVTMAAAAVANAVGTDVQPSSAAITAAVAGATPEQLLALKTAENDFALKMQEMQFRAPFELEQLVINDVKDARERDIKLMQTTGKTNLRASIMLVAIVAALIALVWVMLSREISADTAVGGIIIFLVGKFSNNWDTAFQFEFGTTRSSKTKDDAAIVALTRK